MESIDNDLQKVLGWAKEKAQDGGTPPWAVESYITLRDTLTAIIAGRERTITLEDSLLLDEHLERVRQQEACTDQTNIVQLRPPIVKICLPM